MHIVSDMGVLSEYFPHQGPQPATIANTYYRTFTEPAPSFSTWGGSLYDHPITRAAIERFAAACSKAKPEFVGSKWCKPLVRKLFETWPNDLMMWPAFLAKAATIYEMDTTVFIVPGLDRNLNTIALFPLKPSHTDVVDLDGEPWFIFHLYTGEVMAIEVSRVAVISKFQYLSDFFGEGNAVMNPTLGLMDAQRQAEMQAIQNGARIRFIGRVAGMTHGDDLKRKREQFYVDNLSQANRTGLMLYDNTFQDIEQIDEKRFIIDKDEMERVTKPIFYYFGINESILTNDYTEDQWGAWYEGRVEPFLIALSEALSKALFTQQEVMRGNYVMFSSSRLQYASNRTKLEIISKIGGMGVLKVNECRDIMQQPPMDGGEARIVRGEYYLIDDENNIIAESGGHNGNGTDHSGWYDDQWDDHDGPDDESGRSSRDGDGDGIIGE